jgi:hypothetical protein
MGYIETHGVKFYNSIVNGSIRKMGSPWTDPNVGYITRFNDPDDVLEIISDLQSAIKGSFADISNSDITVDNYIASIEPNGVIFYSDDGQELIGTVPLQDVCDLAIGWHNFLVEPPLHGTVPN